MAVTEIRSLDEVRALADRILDGSRNEPVVCVTTRHHESQPLIDVDRLASACAPLTIHVVRTGELTWELTAMLPERFEVFGGAARIWWPGLQESDDPRRHPLFFCWSSSEAGTAADRLIRDLSQRGYIDSDGFIEAAATSTTAKTTLPVRPPWVRGHPIENIAIGDILDGTVIEALPGGAEVEVAGGVHGWLVWRKRMGPIKVGDTVAVEVVGIDEQQRRVEINPLPGRAPGEQAAEPSISVAATVSDGAAAADRPDVEAALATAKAGIADLRSEAEEIRRELAGELAAARARVLAFAETEMKDVLSSLERDLGEAQSEAASLRQQLLQAERDKREAIQEMRKHRDRAADATKRVRSERDRRVAAEDKLRGRGVHDDESDQFRHEVEVARQQLGNSDASVREVPFVFGTDFLESVDRIEGIDRHRIVEGVARLVSGRVDLLGALDVHELRESAAGGAPPRVRADGARAMRASLQQGAAAARRLHFWRLPDNSIELANIVYHDDMSIS